MMQESDNKAHQGSERSPAPIDLILYNKYDDSLYFKSGKHSQNLNH
jgi:hypothetical protein